MRLFSALGLLSLGIYRSLSLIGIAVGVLLFMRAINGNGLGALLSVAVGIFVVLKEILDMFHYASFLNFVGVGVGIVLLIAGFSGTGVGNVLLGIIGAFVIIKEIIDVLHSGH